MSLRIGNLHVNAESGGRTYRSFALVRDRIAKNTQSLDLDLAHVARLHIDRRLARRAYTGRRPGHDDISRKQRYSDADESDQRCDIEDEVRGRCFLHHRSVQSRLEFQPAGTGGKLVSRYKCRPERSGAVEVLAHGPLWRTELKIPDCAV